MSLFRGQDTKLPLLTRWYQVEPLKPGKMRDLFTTEMFLFLQEEWHRARGDKTPFGVNPYMIKQYAELHEVTRLMMDALADDALMDTSVLARLESLFREDRRPVEIEAFAINVPPAAEWADADDFDYDENAYQRGGLMSANNFLKVPVRGVFLRQRTSIDVSMITRAAVLSDFRDLFNEHKTDSIVRCEDCKNPFVMRRANNNKFCSRRCADRFGARRRRRVNTESTDTYPATSHQTERNRCDISP